MLAFLISALAVFAQTPGSILSHHLDGAPLSETLAALKQLEGVEIVLRPEHHDCAGCQREAHARISQGARGPGDAYLLEGYDFNGGETQLDGWEDPDLRLLSSLVWFRLQPDLSLNFPVGILTIYGVSGNAAALEEVIDRNSELEVEMLNIAKTFVEVFMDRSTAGDQYFDSMFQFTEVGRTTQKAMNKQKIAAVRSLRKFGFKETMLGTASLLDRLTVAHIKKLEASKKLQLIDRDALNLLLGDAERRLSKDQQLLLSELVKPLIGDPRDRSAALFTLAKLRDLKGPQRKVTLIAGSAHVQGIHKILSSVLTEAGVPSKVVVDLSAFGTHASGCQKAADPALLEELRKL